MDRVLSKRLALHAIKQAAEEGIPYPTLQYIATKMDCTREYIRQLASQLKQDGELEQGRYLRLKGVPPRQKMGPLPSLTRKLPDKERFLSYVYVLPDGCHKWIGSCLQNGYGRFCYNGVSGFASRIAYELFVGPIPEGDFFGDRPNYPWVLHSCDYKFCVNPGHLFIGTALDAAQDRDRRGRARVWSDMRQRIEALHGQGFSRMEISKELGVHRDNVERVTRQLVEQAAE